MPQAMLSESHMNHLNERLLHQYPGGVTHRGLCVKTNGN